MNLNRGGPTISYVLLHESQLQFVNDPKEGGFQHCEIFHPLVMLLFYEQKFQKPHCTSWLHLIPQFLRHICIGVVKLFSCNATIENKNLAISMAMDAFMIEFISWIREL
jgi:hypothetical protein